MSQLVWITPVGSGHPDNSLPGGGRPGHGSGYNRGFYPCPDRGLGHGRDHGRGREKPRPVAKPGPMPGPNLP